jgi:hypothetical protein
MKEKHPLPYFAAFLQGGDYIINIRVDHDASINKKGFGYIQDIWIQYKKDYEWEISLAYPNQNIIYSNNAEKFVREFKLNRKHTKYIIGLDDLNIIASTKKRSLDLKFKDNFFTNNPDVKKYYGAIISKEQLRYLDSFKQIL